MKIPFRTFLVPLTFTLGLSVTSCKQETKDKIEAAGEAVVEETQEAAEKVGDAVEKTGEAVKEAAGEVKEAVSDEIKKVRVQFDSGASSKTVEGSITGYETIDYQLNVRAGQSMNVSMATQHGATYFNIMEPGEEFEAIFNGSINGNQFEGSAAKSGDYTIRVYMMRSAARRNETASYRLEMIVGN